MFFIVLWQWLHKWTWTTEHPWPPLPYLLSAGLWSLPDYTSLRQKLASAIPTPEVTYSDSGFLTVDALSKSATTGSQATHSLSTGRCPFFHSLLSG